MLLCYQFIIQIACCPFHIAPHRPSVINRPAHMSGYYIGLYTSYAHCRFWQGIFRCNLKGNEKYSEACETGQGIGDSGYILSDTLMYAMKSAQAVVAINDFIEENYCDVSADSTFQV